MKKLKEYLKKFLLSKVFFYIFFTLSFVLIFLYNYIYSNFSNITKDQLLFSLFSAQGTNSSIIFGGFIYVFFRLLIVYIIFISIKSFIVKIINYKIFLLLKIKNKKYKLQLFPFSRAFQNLLIFLFFILSCIYIVLNIGWLSNSRSIKSSFIETNYVDPKKVNINAPQEKQNLIFIYAESLESSFVTSKDGGAFERKIIHNLEKLALSNVNFSKNDMIGGPTMVSGTSWTSAATIAMTAGVPLKTPVDSNAYANFDNFLSETYTLGEVLKANNYNNYLLVGSDASFGGKKSYFSQHGDYKIYDYNYAKKHKWIPSDYGVMWGFEDSKLFKFAKKNLKEISKNDKPFNLTMVTVDTHFVDGYVDKKCDKPFDEAYLNAFHCSDSEIGEFINWLKKQSFYEKTTVVIVGDHLTMQSNILDMFDVDNPDEYNRSMYNVFINSKIETDYTKNREFTSFDLYPTTLAALGFEIDGDKLGLGTNLFSRKKTLSEEFGNNYIDEELNKESDFYNENILGSASFNQMILNNK